MAFDYLIYGFDYLIYGFFLAITAPFRYLLRKWKERKDGRNKKKIMKIIIHLCLGIIPMIFLFYFFIMVLITKDTYESLGYGFLMLPCLVFINAYMKILYYEYKKEKVNK